MRPAISVVLAVVLAACAPSIAPLRGQAELYYKARELIPWVSLQTSYPERRPPDFVHVKDFGLTTNYGGQNLYIYAAYDGDRQLIGIGPEWWGGTPHNLSALVHELTHHLQAGVKTAPDCVRDQEIEAYRVQLKYLAEFHPSARDVTLAIEETYAPLIGADSDAGELK